MTTQTQPRMKEKFYGPVAEKIKVESKISNPMAMPKMSKIIVNVGMGNQIEGTKLNAKAKEQVIKDLALITGQKVIMTKARKSVANFKVREGYENGVMVTLRGDRMWEFFDRLVSLAIPRIKDFRGFSVKSFDGRGSYSFGLTEQGIFPEVDMANAQHTFGMHVTIVFTNSTNETSKLAMTELGFPFKKPDPKKS
ncbi:MAG: 50S ribosomal protein L5 [Algisphaera sp.]